MKSDEMKNKKQNVYLCYLTSTFNSNYLMVKD